MEAIRDSPVCITPTKQENRFLNRTEELKRVTIPDTDKLTIFKNDPKKLDAKFRMALTNPNPEMSPTIEEINAETSALLKGYYNGEVTDDALKASFQSLAKKFIQGCGENGYYYLRDINSEKSMMKVFYGEFRREAIRAALSMNAAEGKEYVTGDINAPRSWEYYNSKYYYSSETAVSVLTDAIQELAQEYGYDDLELPDYKEEKLWEYYNFNSAYSNPMNADEHTITDFDQAPPKDFVWFYQEGCRTTNVVEAKLYEVLDENGNVLEHYDTAPDHFDPKDPFTATMWAAYQDANGNLHRISTDIIFDYSEKDLHRVGDLIQFSGQFSQKDSVNNFLKNLQVYQKGYFSRFRNHSNFDFRV